MVLSFLILKVSVHTVLSTCSKQTHLVLLNCLEFKVQDLLRA